MSFQAVGANSLSKAISSGDCSTIGEEEVLLKVFCKEFVELQDRHDDLAIQLYITAGVIGGAALVLFILVIVLFVKLNNAFKDLYGGDELQKRGFSTYTGRQMEAHNPTFAPSPPPFAPAMNKTLAFDNGTAGGVRVLPRNPPILRNGNY